MPSYKMLVASQKKEDPVVISMLMRRLRLPGSLTLLGLAILLVASPVAQAKSDPTFIGSADSVTGNVGTQLINATPVTLPPSGTPQQNSLATFNQTINGITIQATDLKASVAVENGTVQADASLKNIKVTIGTGSGGSGVNTITTDAATEEATAGCDEQGNAVLNHNTTITNLVVNNQSISNPSVSPPINLPGFGTLTPDFSFVGGTGSSAGIVASALRIESTDRKTVIDLAFTNVHIDCTPGVPPSGGGPIPQAGARPPWPLWGALLTTLGVVGLGGTLAMRRRWVR